MIQLRDIFFWAPLSRDSTAASAASGCNSRRRSIAADSRACAAAPDHELSSLFLFIVVLFSCSLTFTLCGCLGGTIISPAASVSSSPLRTSPNTVNFGGVALGNTVSETVSLTNQGSAAVTVSQVSVSGQPFSVSGVGDLPITIAAGGTYILSVNFSPNATGTAAGQLMIGSNATADGTLTIGLSGVGTTASATNSLELISFNCNQTAVTGAGSDNCTVTVSAAAASGGFAVNLASSNSAVSVPASVTVVAGSTTAIFTATVSAVNSAQTATLTASAGSVTEIFALQLGTGVATLSLNATTIAFGNVNLNSPATQSLVLSSTGASAVTVSAATVIGNGFTISGAGFPISLTTNQTATLSVQFDPTVAGAASGTLTIVSTSLTNPIAIIGLSGTGVVEVPYQVNLSWDAPTSSPDPVAGYYVYRSPSGASTFQQLNIAAVTQTSYVDTGVQDGQTYDYIVESVDAAGDESAPSNTATIPIP